MKKLLAIALALTLSVPLGVFAAPPTTFTSSVVPITSNLYYLGTSTPSLLQWLGIFTKAIQVGDLGGSGTRCVQTDNNGLLSKAAAACGSGGAGGTPGGSDKQVQFNDAGGFGGDANLTFSKGTGLLSGLSAFFTFTTTTNFLATGSSTLQNFTGLKSTTTNATTTSLAISSILSKLLKTDGNGSVIPAVAGTDYQAAITPAALTKTDDTNVTLTLGGSPSTALLAATSLTLGWTGTLADSRVADNLTISGGTVDNSIIGGTTPAAGTFTNLLVTGSSTLQNFTGLNSTTTNATTTTISTGIASTTNLYINQSSGCLQVNSTGKVVSTGTNCTTGGSGDPYPFQGAGNSTSTLTQFNLGLTAFSSSTISALTVTNGTTTNATSTVLSTTLASTTNLTVSSIKSALLVTNSSGTVAGYGGASACASNNFVTALSALGATTCGSSTISGIALGSNLASLSHDATFSGTSYNGSAAVSDWGIDLTHANTWSGQQTFGNILVTGSSTLQAFTFTNATGTNATTTVLSTTIASTTNLTVSGVKSALLITNSSGTVSGYGGASACSSNNFVTTISALGATTCGTATISGVSLGSNLASLSHGSTLTGTSYNGSATVSNWDIDLTVGNVWTAASTTFSGGLTFTTGTTTSATSTNFFSTKASTTQLYLATGLGCLQANSAGLVASTGSNCGSGGGGTPNSKFATTTGSFLALTPNGGTTVGVGIGTTTPAWALQIASSTRSQLTLSDGIAGDDHLSLRWVGSTLYFASSSNSTYATSTNASLSINTNQPSSLAVGTSTASNAVLSAGTYTYAPAIASTTMLAFLGFQGSSTPSLSIDTANNNGTVLIATSSNAVSKLGVLATNGKVYMSGLTTAAGAQTGYICYDANGQLIQDSAVCIVSALKFKKDINPLSLGLDAVLKMKPVTYYLKTPFGKEDAGEQIGFIADWSESVVPDLVTHDSNGDVHGFNYPQYTAVLTKAIQELNAKVSEGAQSAQDKAQSAENKWQDIALVFFGLYVIYNEWDKRKK